MKQLFLLSFVYIIYTSNIFSQVSIYPEIGLNYRPYTLTYEDKYNHRTPEPYVNIVGEVKLNSKLVLNTKIGYVFRQKNSKVFLHCGIGACYYEKFINRDMPFSLSIMYPITRNIRMGLGGGVYYKLNAHYVAESYGRDFSDILSYTENFLYNSQILLDYQYKDFKFIATYYYLFNDAENGSYSRLINGNNAVSFGVGYQLFKGKSKK